MPVSKLVYIVNKAEHVQNFVRSSDIGNGSIRQKVAKWKEKFVSCKQEGPSSAFSRWTISTSQYRGLWIAPPHGKHFDKSIRDSGWGFSKILYHDLNRGQRTKFTGVFPINAWDEVRHFDIGSLDNFLMTRLIAIVEHLESQDDSLNKRDKSEDKRVIRDIALYLHILLLVSIVLFGSFIEIVGLYYFDRYRFLGIVLFLGGVGIICLGYGLAVFDRSLLDRFVTFLAWIFLPVGVQAWHV